MQPYEHMLDPSTIVLVSTVAVLGAVEAPLPVNITAMALVALVLRYLLKKDGKSHDAHDARLSELEAEVEAVRKDASDQRGRAHKLENTITGQVAALAMLLPAAEKCSCGTMAPYVPVLYRLTAPKETP